jgi:hypothetical protein
VIVMIEVAAPFRMRPKHERFGVFNRWIWAWFSIVYLPGLGINDMRKAYRQADRTAQGEGEAL